MPFLTAWRLPVVRIHYLCSLMKWDRCGKHQHPFFPTASFCGKTKVHETLSLGPKGQQRDLATWLWYLDLLNIHTLYYVMSCRRLSSWSGKAAWQVLRTCCSGLRGGREMLLICPFGVFFSPVSFAKAPLNSYVEPDLFSQHDLATFWLCVEIRFRNQQQTECNTRKLCWFDFSCTRGFLVSCNQKNSPLIKKRKGMLHHRVLSDTKPLWRRQTVASKPGHEQALGLDAFHLFSLSLFIECGRSYWDPCSCSCRVSAWLLLQHSHGWSKVRIWFQ